MLVACANCVEVGVLDAIFGCRDGCGRWSKEAESGSLTIREDDGIAVHYRKNGMSERINESFAYKHILNNIDRYGKWIQAPTPQYLEESFNFDDLSKSTLMNEEIMFDAPNVVRMGKTLLYQISNSGNLKGYEWLCQTFPEYNIHLTYQYSGAHLDSTVIPLKPGLVLLNGQRCTPKKYPKIF